MNVLGVCNSNLEFIYTLPSGRDPLMMGCFCVMLSYDQMDSRFLKVFFIM
ncbi:hypothetical protein LINPERPRIM_LOCUS38318 [Linum perenne]